MAQRLVRKLCGDCKTATIPGDKELRALRIDKMQAAEANMMGPTGCKRCRNNGFRGRMALIEILNMNDEVRGMVNDELTTPQIRKRARELGMRTLREDGVRKVLAGMTTADEVIEATMGDAD